MADITNTNVLRKRLAAARAVLRGEAVAAVEVGVIHNVNIYAGMQGNMNMMQTVQLERWDKWHDG